MSIWVAYSALLTGVLVWLLLIRKLSAKSWEAEVLGHDPTVRGFKRFAPARVGLWVFLGVITSLFGLFISAYYIRMGYGHGAGLTRDWDIFLKPPVLWLNTALLLLGSIAMQWARSAAAGGKADRTRAALLIGGALTIAFLAGQLYAWQELRFSGFFTPRNPAIAFFYLLTAVHGLHLLGGLYVWGRTVVRMSNRTCELKSVRLSVELCSVYWHYLLVVWLVLFALLLKN